MPLFLTTPQENEPKKCHHESERAKRNARKETQTRTTHTTSTKKATKSQRTTDNTTQHQTRRKSTHKGTKKAKPRTHRKRAQRLKPELITTNHREPTTESRANFPPMAHQVKSVASVDGICWQYVGEKSVVGSKLSLAFETVVGKSVAYKKKRPPLQRRS